MEIMIVGLLRPNDWEHMTNAEKFESINIRMDMIYSYSERKQLRKIYASKGQFAEEYSKENEAAVVVCFLEIRKEYEEIREWIINKKLTHDNLNANVLEDMLIQDVESTLLGDKNERYI